MKNLFKLFVPVAVAAIALTACNKEQETITNPGEIQITVLAKPEAFANEGTKTYIGGTDGKTILWGTDEYMKLALTAGESNVFATSSASSASAWSGSDEAMFEFSVTPGSASSYVYQGMYPASAAVASSNTNLANYKVKLPEIQNATAASYDPAAYIMVAKPESFTDVQTEWVASFLRGTALNKITLKNVPSGVSFKEVKITAPAGKYLAGARHIDLTAQTTVRTDVMKDIYDGGGRTETVEVKYATALSGTSVDVWFTSWDVEVEEGETLVIEAYTTDDKVYTKTINVPSGKSIKFQEGYLNTLGASLSGIDPTNVSKVADGDYVILAKNGTTYYALKGEASGTRIASVDYSGSTSSYNGSADIIWSIASSGDSYTIKNGGNYVGWTSGNTADLIAEADYDATKCLMTIESNGDDTYKIYVTNDDTRILAKNQSNAYFGFYTGSGYKDIVLVPATAMEQVATPSFDPAAGVVASGTTVTISCATSGATIHYTLDGTDPTSSSATYSSAITITATTTIKAIAVKTDMADSEVAIATYTVSSTGSVTLTESEITMGSSTVKGTENGQLAYRLGTSNNDGSLTIDAGYSSITFTIAGWASGTRSFSITNGTIGGSSSLSPSVGAPSGTISAGFERTDTGTEYTIDVTDPTQEVVISGHRGILWGFTAVEASGSSVTWNLKSISVTTPPTKTSYTEGESFDPTGMVVTGHFEDEADNTNTKDEAVTGYTVSPDGALATTDDHVTITYQGLTTTQTISVSAAPGGGTVKKYVKVTSGAIGGEYLIVRESSSYIYDGSLSNPDAANNYQTASDLSSLDYDTWKAYAVTIEAYESGYSIKTAAGKYIGRNANSNGIDSATSPTSPNYVNTISFASNGTVTILGNGGRKFNFNSSSGKFRYFASGNTTEIYLYQLQEVSE